MILNGKDKYLYFVAILLTLILAIGCDSLSWNSPHPSDQDLIKNFEKHEAEFNELIKMPNEDSKVIRIAYDFTRLEDNWGWPRPESEWGFPRQRWDQYRSLFKKLELRSGLSRETGQDGTVIYLTAFAKGMVNRGSAKGYAYSENEQSPLFDSLDQNPIDPQKRKKHDVVYKKIKGNWYLSFDW